MLRISTKKLLNDLKLTFITGSLPGLAALIRSILYGIPFSVTEDGLNMLRVILTGWILMIFLRLSFYMLFLLIDSLQTISFRKLFSAPIIRTGPVLIIGTLIFSACNITPTGITKELDTGLTTTYSGLKPERSRIVMNGETLTHRDIPIGESFRIINEGISGFTVQDGMVSVTCSLEIKDKKGKILLSEPDLFYGKNFVNKDSASVLSCTVNTGEPMEWEENYEVKAVFTDNWGKGRIENVFTLRAIDIP